MKNKSYLFLIIMLFSYFGALSQVATIIDKDGYTNVRLHPDKNSEIIFTVKENRVFWVGEEIFDKSNEWTSVYIPKNIYSLACGFNNFFKGYIHKSRIHLFEEMKIYKKDNINFRYTTKPFTENKKIVEISEEKYIQSINGLFIWGTDGMIPQNEIDKLEISKNNVNIEIPEILKQDLYEKINLKSIKFYKINDTYFIYHWNSDGAGFYEVVWVIENNVIKQRLVGTPI